ncbi:hypothetical protein ABW19_dt0204489 [Dactylella cylindrospora]|nr:hypothetical protein ABW19_dt0204489 [Dactylella cylindrospora]
MSSRPSRSRIRNHLATYPILSKPYHIVNDYAPFHLPSLLLNNVPGLPDPFDAAVDDGLTAVDRALESRVSSVKQGYETWVCRPRENIRTGVDVYTEWGKGQVAGGLRRLEEGIFNIGEYFLPGEADDDHEHADMKSYWTSTESIIDSDEEDDGSYGNFHAHGKLSTKEGALRPLTPATASSPRRPRSASAPSLPPFQSSKPDQELQNIGRLLFTYAHRTYIRNAHKSPSQILHDALDLAKAEANKVRAGIDEKYSIEIGYLHKMMEAGR